MQSSSQHHKSLTHCNILFFCGFLLTLSKVMVGLVMVLFDLNENSTQIWMKCSASLLAKCTFTSCWHSSLPPVAIAVPVWIKGLPGFGVTFQFYIKLKRINSRLSSSLQLQPRRLHIVAARLPVHSSGMAPSLQAVNIPIHLLLHPLMTRSHGLNLGKGSFSTPYPETQTLNFKSTVGGLKRAKKDLQLLNRFQARRRPRHPRQPSTLPLSTGFSCSQHARLFDIWGGW